MEAPKSSVLPVISPRMHRALYSNCSLPDELYILYHLFHSSICFGSGINSSIERVIFVYHLKVSMTCPVCDFSGAVIEKSAEFEQEGYIGYRFITIITSCKKCGYSWNCIFTKKDEKSLLNKLIPKGLFVPPKG